MDINFLAFLNREKPLAMYIFAKDHAVAQKFLDNTSSGGFVFNDTMMHAGCKFIYSQHAHFGFFSTNCIMNYMYMFWFWKQFEHFRMRFSIRLMIHVNFGKLVLVDSYMN